MTDDEAHKVTVRDPYLPYSQSLALGLTTLGCIYLCIVIIAPFFSVLAWSLALAVVAHPLSSWLQTRIRNRSLASLLALTVAALMIFLPTLWVMRVLVNAVAENIAVLTQGAGLTAWLDPAIAPPHVAPLLAWLDQTLHLQRVITDMLFSVAQRLPHLVTLSLIGLAQALVVLFTTFFFIRDGALFFSYLTWVVPLSAHHTEQVVGRILDTVHACLFGVVLMALLQGALGAAIFWWLKLPEAALWGVVMGLLAVVPYLGAFIIWIPTALVLAMHGRWNDAALLVVWGSIVIGLADNFLYPVLVGKRLHYHTLLIFFFLLGGVFVFGSAGIVLGPVLVSLTHSLIGLWQHKDLAYPLPSRKGGEQPTETR